MLKPVILAMAGACAVGALVALAMGAFAPALIFGAWAVLLAIGTLYERVIYKKTLDHAPGPGWERTPERFVDPASGKPVTVYTDPASGERQYVQE